MKSYLKLIIILLLATGCNSDNQEPVDLKSTCGVENPTEDLGWLKNEIEDRERNVTGLSKYRYIKLGTFNNKAVIIYANCCPTCNSVYPVYNCEGEFIGIIGNRNEDIPFDILSEGEVIWKTNNSECF